MTALSTTQLGVGAIEPTRRAPQGLRYAWIQLRSRPLGMFGLVLVLILMLAAILAPFIAPYDPAEQNLNVRLTGPSAAHLLGTDELGRDSLSRVLWGAQISLRVGVIAVGLGTLTGALIGLITGYFGGWIDLIVQRIMDALMAFPAIILAMAMLFALGPSLENVMIAIAIIITPGNSRIIRSTVLSVKENVYVEAARTIGAGTGRILFFHILPNVMAPILVLITLYFGNAILIEASLSFLGLGVQPPTPSWGAMLNDSGRMFFESNPWIAIVPGAAISLGVMGFNLLGDAIRDIFDPRLRGAR